jgi:hypothetical protein
VTEPPFSKKELTEIVAQEINRALSAEFCDHRGHWIVIGWELNFEKLQWVCNDMNQGTLVATTLMCSRCGLVKPINEVKLEVKHEEKKEDH